MAVACLWGGNSSSLLLAVAYTVGACRKVSKLPKGFPTSEESPQIDVSLV